MKLELSHKMAPQMLASAAMQQAYRVLQMPVLELAEWLAEEVEQNPILEWDPPKCRSESDERSQAYQESLLCYTPSLYQHLMEQVPLAFEDSSTHPLIEWIIGNLDHNGFLIPGTIEESAETQMVLKKIQTLDPPGIGARSVQDSLLIQLRLKGRENSLAYQIISHHYDDLIHNRLPAIAKGLARPLSLIQRVIRAEISPLEPHPARRFSPSQTHPITVDLLLHFNDGSWEIEINNKPLPRIQIAPVYQESLSDPSLQRPEKGYIRRHLAAGKWLQRIVSRRHETLLKIGRFLIQKIGPYLSGEGEELTPMTLQEMAQTIGLHESTVARAVSQKYLSCPLGTLPIRSLFSHCLPKSSVSQHSVREKLKELIVREDKKAPLSDDHLAKELSSLGYPCARRTITKYRKNLQIAPSSHRRRWL